MSAARSLVLGVLILTVSFLPAAESFGQEREREPAQLWADFNHYVLIARPDLAQAAGAALLEEVDDEQLLDIVEASDYREHDRTLQRAARVEEVREVAGELERRIQQGRIARSRDQERIVEDIRLLGEGQRRFQNATQRLAAAGQYAAPHMLVALQDRDRERLHPYIVSSMVIIGEPLVDPLAEALPQLRPAVMIQIAQVLAEIGYPQALPSIKQVLENDQTDADARRVVQRAYDRLTEATGVSRNASAARLYLQLAESRYRTGTRDDRLPSFDAAEDRGILWQYSATAGLVPVPVPPAIHADALAMRSTRRALALDADLDPALTLYLAANLRRANRLGDGEQDPSYGSDRRPPAFYALLAGPVRLHEVLDRALTDNDPALALDAIAALSNTASARELIDEQGQRQPLMRALSHPDRRVRFHAAEALANARPTDRFDGSHRVVPVLGEAVRQQDVQYAAIIADDQDSLNRLMSLAGEQGYEAFGGLSLGDVFDEIEARPGVDLLVTAVETARVQSILARTRDDYKLAATPLLAVVTAGQQARLNELVGDDGRFHSVVLSDQPQRFAAALEQVNESVVGEPIGEAESEQIALTALRLLHGIARGGSEVYPASDAQRALTQALTDSRESVVADAARVLAELQGSNAQQAIARTALDTSGDIQISLLGSLATSAIVHGNQLGRGQSDALLELMQTSTGDTAVAAARAHGALALPTANAVKMIQR
ncbi:MAG: HEAT repeat domain-containing protein [Phycisphaeraceae bacterium]